MIDKYGYDISEHTYCSFCGRAMIKTTKDRGFEIEVYWQCPRWGAMFWEALWRHEFQHDLQFLPPEKRQARFSRKTGGKIIDPV